MNIACTQKEKPEKEDWQYINDMNRVLILPTQEIEGCILADGSGDDNGKPYTLLNVPGALMKISGYAKIELLVGRK